MCLKKKSKTTTSEQTHMTQTPTNPAWVESGLEGIGGQINNLSKVDPYSLVAGPDPLQTQAAQGAAGLTGSPWNFDGAAGVFRGLAGNPQANEAQSASVLDRLGDYMSPFTKDVVDTSLADFDHGAGQTRAAQMLDLANDETFGGSGGSILRSLTEGELSRGRGTLSAGLRDQAFGRGAALSGEDAARRQQASMFNAQQRDAALQRQMEAARGLVDTSTAFDANNRANVGAQADIGSILQQIAQRKAASPLGLLSTQAGLYGGLPLNLLHGQTADGTSHSDSTSKTTVSDPLGQIGNLMNAGGNLAAGLAMFSDRRLKRDIVKLGERPDGLAVYLYRYLWSPLRFVGVMAQEVLKVNPAAVLVHPSGFLMVDYGRL